MSFPSSQSNSGTAIVNLQTYCSSIKRDMAQAMNQTLFSGFMSTDKDSLRGVGNLDTACQSSGDLSNNDNSLTTGNLLSSGSNCGVGGDDNRNGHSRNNGELSNDYNMLSSGSDSAKDQLGARISTLAMELGEGFEKLAHILLESVDEEELNISISLRLEGIGEMRLDVRMVKKDVYIVASGTNSHLEDILTFGINDLKNRLENCGLRLARLDVVTPD
ncbi:MAG: hypothetical protein JXR91_11210 [Deltaproteobacteria bacterium]|nr:hypothetical protein [Deltaproteobacteria bacterium]